jgi:FkbM family methyltransferase
MPSIRISSLEFIGSVVRRLPNVRGKARLVRRVVGKSALSRPIVLHDREGNCIFVPNLIEPVGFGLWMDGAYEPEVLSFLKSQTSSRSIVLDVGANIGAFTLPLAKHVSSGRVVAIEAAASVVRVLRENVARNRLSNVDVVECAASTGETASVPFYEAPADHFGMGSSAPQFNVPGIHVQARSIDDVLLELSVPEVSAIKVDVEGYEAHVFLGAKGLLSRSHPPVIFEFCDWAEQRAFPGKLGWAQEILAAHGYALWKLPDFVKGRAPLTQPVREGFHSIVAIWPSANQAAH